MKMTSSLMRRALLALLLTAGFYGLALGVAGLLLFIPYAELHYAHRLHARLALFCLIGAGAILWSILPRWDRFKPPGPALNPKQHPRLFAEVKDIAQKTQQQMPVEVYLVPEVNAFVTERGGFMGLGSRRVMGIGLPLLQALTVSQFRAVLAHEFGHYYGGDTKLGIWIYKTRMAIIRTVMGLGGHSWLQQPFVWYANMFLRITHSISRYQEFVADNLAARVAGPKALAGGLCATHGVGLAFQAFWQNEFAPIINSGYRPPMAEGFAQFIQTPSIAQVMNQIVEREMDSVAEADPYDTHPSLRERIAAVQALPPGPDEENPAPALSLLEDVPGLEHQVFTHIFGEQQVKSWQSIDWEKVGITVYLPLWKRTLEHYHAALSGVTLGSLPAFLASPERLTGKIRERAGKSLSVAELQEVITNVVGQALTVALINQGWELMVSPGADITLQKEALLLEPFALVSALNAGKLSAEAWLQQGEAAGIIQVDLGSSIG